MINNILIQGYEFVELILIVLVLAIAIDLVFGELPTKIHPVVFIGKLIDFFTNRFKHIENRFSGFLLTIAVIIVTLAIFSIILILASFNIIVFIAISSIILSSTFSIKLLLSSAEQIKKDLQAGIEVARKSMSYLVSRNTAELSESRIISATIETLSENITDSAISPIFYYILAIILIIISTAILNPIISMQPSIQSLLQSSIQSQFIVSLTIIAILVAIFYRVINTLDAMVGYKNKQYMKIGYFPAKFDDVLNYIPARFGGLAVVLAAKIYKKSGMDWKNAYNIMKRDARNPPSPNSGFTMAAVAGALDITLVKEGVYVIGNNENDLKREYIEKAVKLSRLAIYQAIFILLVLLIFFIFIAIILQL